MRIHIAFTILVLLSVCKLCAQNDNYIRTYHAREEVKTDLSVLTDQNQITKTTEYFDGLGRPVQTVLHRAAPTMKDIVSGTEYDVYGRSSKSYLPYTMGTVNNGNFRSDWQSETAQFYSNSQNDVVDEPSFYFQESSYESSPLNRVTEVFGPGSAWRQVNNEKPVSYQYRPNDLNDQIPHFKVTSSHQIVYVNDYAAGQLWVNEVTDEDGHSTLEWVNGLQQVICRKAEVDDGVFFTTYYVYDQYGLLSMVIPPQAAIEAVADWGFFLNDYSFRRKWLYLYRHDHRQRLIEKQIPGSDPISYIYDNRDRLVLTQDGNMRGEDYELVDGEKVLNNGYEGKSYKLAGNARIIIENDFVFTAVGNQEFKISSDPIPASKWLFTKYDRFNRSVMTGFVMLSGTPKEIQDQVNNVTDFEVAYVGDVANDVLGYDNTAYPQVASESDVLTVTYYDNYDFKDDFSWGFDFEETGHNDAVIGQLTGSLTRKLGGSLLRSINYYDERFRPLYTVNENHLGGTDKVRTLYDNLVSPRVVQITRIHSSNNVTKTITNHFKYDHMDRLKEQLVDIDGDQSFTKYEYDELGNLKVRNLNGMQSTSYKHNIRGWIAQINGGANLDDENDKFGMNIKYTNSGLFNGSIGEVEWKSLTTGNSASLQSYQYEYDGLGRIKKALYNTGLSNAGHFDVGRSGEGITYDANGNIQRLERHTQGNLTDDLSYQYNNGNQLSSLSDASSSNDAGFVETLSEGMQIDEYIYDRNGNMLADANKGITSISYNYLNLPEAVTLPTGTVYYIYDALGNKLQMLFDKNNGSADEKTDYLSGVHYLDDIPAFLQFENGRYQFGSQEYHYDLTDHLGNVRVTFKSGDETVRPYEDFLADDAVYGVSANSRTFTLFEDAESSDVIDVQFENRGGFGTNGTVQIVQNGQVLATRSIDGFNWSAVSIEDITLASSGKVSLKLIETDGVSVYIRGLTSHLVGSRSLPDAEVIQQDDYYPFGLTFNSWQPNPPKNLYGFQGQEFQDELGWHQYKWRNADPALGRFFNVDPLSESFYYNSSYAFSENRVVDGVELEGLEYISVNNTGLSPDVLQNYRNTDGTYNLILGDLAFLSVELVTYDGEDYFNLGEDVFFGQNGWSLAGTDDQRISEWIYNSIGPTIPEVQFIGWNDKVNNVTCDDCFTCCTMQLDQVGLESTNSSRRVQILDRDNEIADQATFYRGISFIHDALEAGNAIRVGVDYNGNSDINVDEFTDHFVTIVGRGSDSNGAYFRFYENAVGSGNFGSPGRTGVSPTNRLYVNSNNTITGTSVWGNTNFSVTMIRPNTNQN